MDRRYKLVRLIHVSTASEHDTLHFEPVLDAAGQGWRLHIQRKGVPGKPLSECQQQRNRRIARTRARVEHVYAGL